MHRHSVLSNFKNYMFISQQKVSLNQLQNLKKSERSTGRGNINVNKPIYKRITNHLSERYF